MTYFRLTASASMLVSVSRTLHVARLLFCTATCKAAKNKEQHPIIILVWGQGLRLVLSFYV